jgi:hypothetical protein
MGLGTFERWFKHSDTPGVLKWEQAPIVKAEAKTTLDSEKVLELVPFAEPVQKSLMEAKIQETFRCGRDKARQSLSVLEGEGKIHSWTIKRKKGKSGGPIQGWCRTPQGAENDGS